MELLDRLGRRIFLCNVAIAISGIDLGIRDIVTSLALLVYLPVCLQTVRDRETDEETEKTGRQSDGENI